jgi:hypothetical protein
MTENKPFLIGVSGAPHRSEPHAFPGSTEMADRQTGRTTRQMQRLAKGGIFIWCNERIDYPMALARSLGREDIAIKPLSWLTPHNFRGRIIEDLAIDHAIGPLTDDHHKALDLAKIAVKRRSTPGE